MFPFSHLTGICMLGRDGEVWVCEAENSLASRALNLTIRACCRNMPSSADIFDQKVGLANNIGTRGSAVNYFPFSDVRTTT